MKQKQKIIPVQPTENYAILHLKNDKIRKLELHFGEGFLSQQGRFINMPPAINSIDIYNAKGNKRTIQ